MGVIPLCMLYTLMVVSIGLPKTDATTVTSMAASTATASTTLSTTIAATTTYSTTSPTTAPPVDCLQPTVSYATATLAVNGNTTFGATATATCNQGYTGGPVVMTCHANATWSPVPNCTAVDCLQPTVSYASVILAVYGNTTFGTTAMATCNQGYIGGHMDMTCQANATWSPGPSCTPVDCLQPTVSYATATLAVDGNTTFGATATATCNQGYNGGQMDMTCQAGATWSPGPNCTPVNCLHPTVSYATATLTVDGNTTFGATAMATCNQGYNGGQMDMTCQAGATWSPGPTCTPVNCLHPTVSYATAKLTVDGNSIFGATATATCNQGYNGGQMDMTCQANATWSPGPSCTPVDCLQPTVSYATATLAVDGNSTFGATAMATCNQGYNGGQMDMTCQANATWSPGPSCTPVDCLQPTVSYASVILAVYGNTTFGATAMATCNQGYNGGQMDMTCQANATWSPGHSCTPVDCLQPTVSYATATLAVDGNTTFGATATGTCNQGYNGGQMDMTCQAGATWSPGPTCTPVNCLHPTVSYATATLTVDGNSTFGATATATCNQGYNGGQMDMTCQANTTWSPGPNCTPVDCLQPTVSYATATLAVNGNTTFGATATATCNQGYNGGQMDMTCQANATWSPGPNCTPVDCLQPTVSYATVTLAVDGNTTFGATATATCNQGYNGDPEVLTCEAGATWSPGPSCTPVDCDQPTVSYANVTLAVYGNTTFGATATATCNQGYNGDPEVLTCEAGATWSPGPTCTPVACHQPTVSYASVILAVDGNTTFGATATATCNQGYTGAQVEMTCQADATWSRGPSCAPVDCHQPTVSYASVILAVDGNTTFGARTTAICNQGYTGAQVEMTCQADATWSRGSSCTPVDCHQPTVSYASVILSVDGNTTFGATATATCNQGYAGAQVEMTCQADATWSRGPSCTPVDCHQPTVSYASVILAVDGNTTFGATAAATCNQGYTGAQVEMTCQADATWSPGPSCTPVDCDTPNTANATITLTAPGHTTFGATASGHCNGHHGYIGTSVDMTCLSSGTWSTGPICNVKGIQLKAEVTGQSTDHVILNITRGNMPTECFVVYEVNGTQPTGCSVNVEGPSVSYTYPDDENLAAGTCYKLVVKSMYTSSVNEFPQNVIVNACTKPTAMEFVAIPPESRMPTQVLIKFIWHGISTSALHFLAVDSNNTTFQITSLQVRAEPEEKRWSATIGDLTPATEYDVYVHAVQNNIAGDSIHIRTFWTKPSPPQNCSLVEPERETTSLTFHWEPGTGTREYFKIKNVTSTGHVAGTQYKVEDLNPGHHYCYDIFSFGGKGEFSKHCRICAYTKPAIQVSLRFLNITATTFSVTWQAGEKSLDDYYHVTLQELTDGNVTRSDNTTATTVMCGDLAAATEYTVTVWAVRNVTENGSPVTLYSGNISREHYTRPVSPTSMNISHIHVTTFTVHWITVDNITFTQVYIEVLSDRNNYSHTINNMEQTSYPVMDLISGIRYRVYVYTVYADMKSEPKTMEVYTVPSPPSEVSVPVEDITSDSLTVSWTDDDPRFLSWTVAVMSPTTDVIRDIPANTMSTQVTGLTSGTNYTLAVYTSVPGQTSRHALISSYTRPSPPVNGTIALHYEANFTLTWAVNDERFDHYRVIVGEPHPAKYNFTVDNKDTRHVIGGLSAATNYTLSLYTEISSLRCLEPLVVSSYTSPLKPNAAVLTDIGEHSVQINLTNDGAKFDHYCVIYDQDGIHNMTVPSTEPSVHIDSLTAGTEYTFTVYTLLYGILSEHQNVVTSYTRPSPPVNGTISLHYEANFTLTWAVNDERFDHYRVIVGEPHPAKYNFTVDNKDTRHVIGGLSAATNYTVSLYTEISSLRCLEPLVVSSYTSPLKPNAAVLTDIGEHSVQINLTNDGAKFDHYCVIYDQDGIQNMTVPSTEPSVHIDSLTAGTEYTFTVYTLLYGILSEHQNVVTSYTRPSPPVNGTISLHYEANFTLTWAVNDERFDHYRVIVGEPHPAKYNFTVDNKDTRHVIGGLSAATNYTVSLYTEISSLRCLEPLVVSSYTSPLKPNAAVLTDIGEHSVQINLTNDGAKFDHYCVIYDQDGTQNKTVPSTERSVHIDSLTAGTEYTFTVYTLLYGILSEHQNVVTSYTRPLKVGDITLVDVTSSSMEVAWTAPGEGGADSYDVVFNCTSPNEVPPHSVDIVHMRSELNATARGLHPGSFCTVKVNAIAGTESGGEEIEHIKISTTEMAPEQVASLSAAMVSSSAVSVSWGRPDVRNGLIRRYDLLVAYTNGSCVRKIVYNCTDCQELSSAVCQQRPTSDTTASCTGPQTYRTFSPKQNELQEDVGGLQPYTDYTFHVQAFTRCYGPDTSTTTQPKPSSSPRKVTMSARSHNSMTIKWDPPLHPNGVITNYSVTYKYHDPVCHGQGELKQKDVYPNMDLLNLDSPQLTIEGLHPYWDYNITVKAATVKGFGPTSLAVTYRTDEYYPGAIASVTSDGPPEAYSLALRWPEPCFPNGVITNYSVLVENRDTGQSVTSGTNDSSVVWTVPTLPYSNYTIRVAAYTAVGRGNYTVGYSVTTDTARPMQPKVARAESHRSTEITVTWGPPVLYTGPTSYTATAVDSQNSSVTRSCQTAIDFNASACTIAGLEASWNYMVTVTANTVKGSNTSNRVTARTLQAPPGIVTSLIVTPQLDIKSPRVITVAWQPPSVHELNGVIISYTITYRLKDEHNVKYQVVGESVREYVIVGIPPGQYIIKVYAATNAGNGTEASMETTLPAGALLKPNESVTLLIQPSLGVAHNDETEIAVQLPLVHFLCNSSNGEPVKWGVMVAQEGQANAQSYYGSKVSYEEKTFLSWFDVTGRDPIPPYKATPDTWKPCSPTGGSRRRRAADDTLTFIIGRAGDCAGVARTEYCNGKLPDGRSYRVKSFVCTDGGCTETEYSQVFVTAAVTDSVVPIVAGLVSALVVIIAIIVVIVVMRRRQAFCFAKDIENREFSHSCGPPLGTELTEKSTVTGYRSHPVKLIDFPVHVDLLQRESGLLFSEAYRTLREVSPKHPIVKAESQSCRTKNRHANILPFDHSRVKLLPMDDVEGSDYINANYIPGYTSPREYIATQGPITGTVKDFWRMVWEQDVDIIVMLTQCTENGKPKCVQYWPAEVNEPVFYGDLIVSIQSEAYLPDYVLRVIDVKLKKHEKHILLQFCFLKWPDMGCTEESKQLLNFAKSVRGHVPLPRRGPMLVHCSAGVGQTGTFICVDHLLQHIRDHDEVEIFNMVLDMRDHRCNMVQTEDQYVFIHSCLRDYITMDDQEDDDGESRYENTALAAEKVYENTAFNKD